MKRQIRKRILSVILSGAMVLGLFPVTAMAADSATITTGSTVESIQAAFDNKVTVSDTTITLTDDVTLTSPVKFAGGEWTLDLSTHTLSGAKGDLNSDGSPAIIVNHANLTLQGSGSVVGGAGGTGGQENEWNGLAGGNGADAIQATGGKLTVGGASIAGGKGGDGGNGDEHRSNGNGGKGGKGGDGGNAIASTDCDITVNSSVTISGGNGGKGGNGSRADYTAQDAGCGGAGGNGIKITRGSLSIHITDSGSIHGGSGGNGGNGQRGGSKCGSGGNGGNGGNAISSDGTTMSINDSNVLAGGTGGTYGTKGGDNAAFDGQPGTAGTKISGSYFLIEQDQWRVIGTVTVSEDKAIDSGLTVENDAVLTINGGATVTVSNGSITNNGTIKGEGNLSPKLDQTGIPDAPTVESVTANSVTLKSMSGGVNGVEYAYTTGSEEIGTIVEDRWQKETTFNGLTAATSYTFYARYAGNGIYKPSDSGTGVSQYTAYEAPGGSVYSINFTTETITFESVYEVNTNSGFDGTTVISGGSVTPGQTLYIRRVESGGIPASAATQMVIPARPAAPSLHIGNTAESVMISGAYSYNTIAADASGEWTQGTDSAVTVAPGKSIYIRKAATGNTFRSEVQTLTAPSRSDTPNVAVNYAGETLSTTEAMEYSIVTSTPGDPDWQDCTRTDKAATAFGWNGTEEVRVQFRTRATADKYASESVTVTIPKRPETPAPTGENETFEGENDGKLTDLTAGTVYEISSNNGDWQEKTADAAGNIAGLAPGDYKVRLKAIADTNFASLAADVTIARGAERTYTLNIAAPDFDDVTHGYIQPAAQAITISSSGNSDATITKVEADSSDFIIGGSGTQVAVGGSISTWTVQPKAGLSKGTYTATITVTYDNNATAAANVSFTVNGVSQEAPASPELDKKTYNSVTLKDVADNANGAKAQYSMDGGITWQDSTTFTGLAASKEYHFVVRYGEKDQYAASAVSTALTVTTSAAPSGGGSTGGTYTPPAQPKPQPQIRDNKGNTGWAAIEKKLEDIIKNQPQGGSGESVIVDMNGTTTVPKTVLDTVRGKDVTVVFDMGKGISWTINGKDVTGAAGDINLGVKTNTTNIPADVINKVTGEKVSMQISLEHDGKFGFAATLTLNLEPKNKGLYANLFYYNPKAEAGKKLEFICAGKIDEKGNADLLFTHAFDYTIVIDKEPLYVEKPDTPTVPKKGTLLTDSKTKMVYKVTKSGTNGGTVQFVKTKNTKAKTIAIPDQVTIDGITYKVTTIGSKAFYKCTNLTSITIPSKVKKIGNYAFKGCTKLKTINLNTTLLTTKTVSDKAFSGVSTSAVIKVPKSKAKTYKKLLVKKGLSEKVTVKGL